MNNPKESYGYDLTHVIRESLMWKLNLPLVQAQEIAENISEQVVYANWISIQGKELQKVFKA